MDTFLETYFPSVYDIQEESVNSIWETLYMVSVTAFIAGGLGILLCITSVATEVEGILENEQDYNFLQLAVYVFRSVVFVLMHALSAPIARLLVGMYIGTTAANVPLVVGMVPFYSRQIQNAFHEAEQGVIEAAEAMGSCPVETIFRGYLK